MSVEEPIDRQALAQRIVQLMESDPAFRQGLADDPDETLRAAGLHDQLRALVEEQREDDEPEVEVYATNADLFAGGGPVTETRCNFPFRSCINTVCIRSCIVTRVRFDPFD